MLDISSPPVVLLPSCPRKRMAVPNPIPGVPSVVWLKVRMVDDVIVAESEMVRVAVPFDNMDSMGFPLDELMRKGSVPSLPCTAKLATGEEVLMPTLPLVRTV